ncbi:MAG: hypothetical protein WC856_08320 [Methylococcaceae bacterium]|jgi:hypothetical protein
MTNRTEESCLLIAEGRLEENDMRTAISFEAPEPLAAMRTRCQKDESQYSLSASFDLPVENRC